MIGYLTVRRRTTWATMAIVVAALLAFIGRPSRAASGSGSERRVLDDKWVFAVGGHLTEFRTDASVGSGGTFGTSIRAEDELGVESDQTVVRLDGFYRLNSRQSIGFGFWTLDREGSATIDEQILFEGILYDVGVVLDSKFDTGWFRVDWRYSLVQSDRGEAGFTAGLSSYQFDMAVVGDATVSDGMGGTIIQRIRAEDDLVAPVPTVGIFMNYAIKPKLILRFKADFLDLEVSDLEGKVTDTALLIEWYFSRRVGFGVGSNTTDIEVRDTGSDPFFIDYRQSGLLGYFIFAF